MPAEAAKALSARERVYVDVDGNGAKSELLPLRSVAELNHFVGHGSLESAARTLSCKAITPIKILNGIRLIPMKGFFVSLSPSLILVNATFLFSTPG
jgi:hypothetical protein